MRCSAASKIPIACWPSPAVPGECGSAACGAVRAIRRAQTLCAPCRFRRRRRQRPTCSIAAAGRTWRCALAQHHAPRPATLTRWPTGLPEAASYCTVPWWARASTLASACRQAAGRVFGGLGRGQHGFVGAPGGFQVGVGGADVCLRGVGLPSLASRRSKQLDGLGSAPGAPGWHWPGGPAGARLGHALAQHALAARLVDGIVRHPATGPTSCHRAPTAPASRRQRWRLNSIGVADWVARGFGGGRGSGQLVRRPGAQTGAHPRAPLSTSNQGSGSPSSANSQLRPQRLAAWRGPPGCAFAT